MNNWDTITYDEPKVMGILNITPDSFFDGGTYVQEKSITNRLEEMLTEGADIIDIGAYSTRPNAEDVSEQEEIRRLDLALHCVKQQAPHTLISIDTFRPNVIKHVLETFGKVMVNDISGGTFSKEMIPFVAKNQLPYVCMHIQGTPQTMQQQPQYQDVVEDLKHFFKDRLQYMQSLGLSQCIIDLGFGFGKTLEQNYELLNHLDEFAIFEQPMLVGLSRKSMIQNVLNCSAKEALNGTTVLNTIALLKGASILRVHDVKEAKETIQLTKHIHHETTIF